MKFKLLLILFLAFSFENYAASFSEYQNKELTDKGKRKKQGVYKVKKHRLKKLIQGKRYCDCPKH